MTCEIVDARPHQHETLSELALRSKAHWGYSEAFMQACVDELKVTREAIEGEGVFYRVAMQDAKAVGYYALVPISEQDVELDALFIEPAQIGSGLGKALFRDAQRIGLQKGFRLMIIQGDPNAVGFYQAMGARQVGTRPSDSIEGRELPLFELTLTA